MGMNDTQSLLWKMGLIDNEFGEKLNKNIGLVGNFGEKLKAAFNVVAGAALVGYLDKLVQRAGAIQDTADALEVTTDSLQGLDFTAKQAGASTDTLHNAIGTLKSKSSDAANGNAQVVKSLNALGISAKDFIKLPVDRQLEMIAKGAASAEDKTKAFGAVADLIGTRNAPRLTGVLKELAAQGLDGVTESAKQAGQVMSGDLIDRMDRVGDRIETIKTATLNAGTFLLDFAFKAVDGYGALAGNIVNWAMGMETGYLNTAKAQEELTAAIEDANIALLGTKATTEDIAKAEEARAKVMEATTLEALSGLEKQNFLIDKVIRLEEQRKLYADGTKEALKLQSEILDTQVKLGQMIVKNEEELAKKADELAKKSQLEKNDAIDLIRLQTKGVSNLSEAERARYDQLKLITEQKKIQADIDEFLQIPAEKRTKAENDWLAVCVKASDELQAQITAKTALIEKIKAEA